MVLFDTGTEDSGTAPGGLALEYRLDHDVLAEPDLGTVIINIGLEDVLWDDGVSMTMAVVGDAVHGASPANWPLRRGRRDRRRHADPVQRLPVGRAERAATARPTPAACRSTTSIGGLAVCHADFDAAVDTPGSEPRDAQACLQRRRRRQPYPRGTAAGTRPSPPWTSLNMRCLAAQRPAARRPS